MAMSLFTGCVQRDIPFNKNRNFWAHSSSVDDVNISDDNLTESEMMITEDGEENKMARIEFPESEYYRLARTGKGTIKGTIYVKDYYDRPILGASTRLYLNPVTSYSEQWYEESYLGGYKMQEADPRLFNYLKFTASDQNGNFAFYGVPSGSYYLIGTVKCGEECGYESTKNIRIATKVSVYGNQVVEQDLTRAVE
ncbi:carboxypeptidase regulatory-like domain-containing protein [Sulfurovum sp. TSL1]|uniref:carboxypeptidase regulatory-like domain-containing protein n=1 Tax=Sulfurovum sp. TSL1 TaxID=2826994 RepID=UPI001CC81C6A|nr:carboxypeptidase regulatory-like domain-containing protein [Sulfurovum sp. TSL1]